MRESALRKEVLEGCKKALHQRSQSMQSLADKIKNYAVEIRNELSPYIQEAQKHMRLAKKEAQKLGKSAA